MDPARRQAERNDRRAVVEAELARLSTELPASATSGAARWAVIAGELRAIARVAEPFNVPALHLLSTLTSLVEALRASGRPAGQAALGLVGEGLHEFDLLSATVPAVGQSLCEDLTGAMELLMHELSSTPEPETSPETVFDARLEDFVRREPQKPRRRAAAFAAEGAMRLEAVWSGLADYVRRQGEVLGKRVELVATGGELEVSGRAGEALRPALLQLIRNACAHGVESPAARQGAGKPGLAILRLSARRSGDRVEVTLADDGRGVERNAAAYDRNAPIIAPGDLAAARALLQQDAEPTRAGLDLVRGAVEDAGGQMAHSSTPGRGAAFTLTLPAGARAATPPMEPVALARRARA